jgi:hypothetical protein
MCLSVEIPKGKASFAISALVMYFVFAGAAHWLDGKRSGSS